MKQSQSKVMHIGNTIIMYIDYSEKSRNSRKFCRMISNLRNEIVDVSKISVFTFDKLT